MLAHPLKYLQGTSADHSLKTVSLGPSRSKSKSESNTLPLLHKDHQIIPILHLGGDTVPHYPRKSREAEKPNCRKHIKIL